MSKNNTSETVKKEKSKFSTSVNILLKKKNAS